MTLTRHPTPLRDALYAFSLAKSIPDAGLLDEFVRRFPEHAAELTDFAIELALDAAKRNENDSAGAGGSTVSPVVSRAVSRFQNRLFAVRRSEITASTGLPPRSAVNPFAALDRTAFRGLATRLHANSVFIAKLRDRQIDPETITEGFQQRLASEMSVPLELLAAHFAAQPEGQFPQHLKADRKPEVPGRQAFYEAVRTSGLTEQQQRSLMAL